jgi:muconolactone D-isomerase
MEYLVEFAVDVPAGTPESEVEERQEAEAVAAGTLADQGHLLRLWKAPDGSGGSAVLGLYRAESRAELDGLLERLPLSEWMRTTVTPLRHHPNDPTSAPAIV